MQAERREYTRVPVRARAYVSLSLSPEGNGPPLSGLIVDVSRGGLAFQYLISERNPRGKGSLRIIWKNGSSSVCIQEVCCKVSYTDVLPAAFDSSAAMVRCGVQFLDLKSEQKCLIEQLISAATMQGQGALCALHP